MNVRRAVYVDVDAGLYKEFQDRFTTIDVQMKEFFEAGMVAAISQTDKEIADLLAERRRWLVLEGGKNGKNGKTEKILATVK